MKIRMYKTNNQSSFSNKKVLSAIGVALGIAAISFTVLAILPPSEQPFFKAPLRSILTGLGLLSIACPLCIAGHIIKKRSAKSPYFEVAFIATVINIFGFILFSLGLVCIGVSIYALVIRLLDSE
jgi:hypothetical protein